MSDKKEANMKPAILERRGAGRVMTRADLQSVGQKQVQVGACPGGCGAMVGMGQQCSCDAVGMRGVAAIPWSAGLAMLSGMYPRGYSNGEANGKLAAELNGRFPNGCPAPHSDRSWDFDNMDTLYSAPTTLAAPAGTVTSVNVQPEAGCFFAFYWRIVVRDPTTGVVSVDWQWRKPRIDGCPIPCDNLDNNIASQFAPVADPLDERCCGFPVKAFIQRASEDLPLVVPVVNGTAAALEGQVEVRGWCCSTRIC